jgi:hypothetical protein
MCMAAIMITCPTTNVAVHTGQHGVASKFDDAGYRGASFRCSACGSIHVWLKEDAWVAGATPPKPARAAV